MSFFDECSAELMSINDANITEIDTTSLLQCVTFKLEEVKAATASDNTSWLLVLSGALVFFMQTGFAMLCAGCVRKKNVQNTMLKNLLDACGAAIAWYAVGYAFSYGGQNSRTDTTFIGSTDFFSTDPESIDFAFWWFQYAFCAAAATIVAGTLAERCQMAAYFCYSVFISGFVYPVVAHSVWSNNGFLSAFHADPLWGIGVIDFSGSGVIHVTGGMTSLIAAIILGPRKGRFYDARGRPFPVPKTFPGHSIALQLMGTMVLWFGWFGFNPGSALLLTATTNRGAVAGMAAVNTALSASAGAISALFTNLYLQERKTGEYAFDLTMAMNGCLSGLVAITAGCGTVYNWAAVVIGMVAGCLYIAGSKALIYYRIDDAVDAIPVHLVNGMWGVLATGLFSAPALILEAFGTDSHVGFLYSLGQTDVDFTLLGLQCLEILFVAGFSTFTMLPFFIWLNYMGWFRVDSLEETVGLDTSYNRAAAQVSNDEGVTAEDIHALFAKKSAEAKNRRLAAEGAVANDDNDRHMNDESSWGNFTNHAKAPTSADLLAPPESPQKVPVSRTSPRPPTEPIVFSKD